MPLGKRLPDGEMHMECARDTNPNESGLHAIEVAFANDDPNGDFTIHALTGELRLSRGHKTAIILEDLTYKRDHKLAALICEAADNSKGVTTRNKILNALGQEPNLEWQKMYA